MLRSVMLKFVIMCAVVPRIIIADVQLGDQRCGDPNCLGKIFDMLKLMKREYMYFSLYVRLKFDISIV